jgi:hypothetical protein
MAKIKLGSNLADIRGKVNGHVFSKNRSGNYLKTKTNPINRNTTAQAAVRAFFSTLTKGWAALTDAQRGSWNSAALNFKKINSLSDTIALSGHQLYISINRVLQTIGGVVISTAPYPAVVTPVLTASVDADVSDATQVLTYTPAVPATDTWILEATRPLSAGKQSNSQDYKKIDVILTADASPFDITAAYEAVFGTTWKTAGAKIFYRLTPAITLTGVTAKRTNFTTVVVA